MAGSLPGRQEKRKDGRGVIMSEFLGPFESYVRNTEADIQRVGGVDAVEFANVMRSIDYVKNSVYFERVLNFLKKYIVRDPALIYTCLSASVTNITFNKSEFKKIAFDLCENYVEAIKKLPLAKFDIGLSLDVIKIFIEIGFPIKKPVSIATCYIIFFDEEKDTNELKNIIQNYSQTLDAIAEIADQDVYAECFIFAVNELFYSG